MSDQEVAVLLIEDDPTDARLIERLVEGIETPRLHLKWVDTLTAGLEYLSQHTVDAVLLDLNLPDSRGLGALETLLAHAPNVPVIVVAGLADEHLALQAIREGAQDYLIKGEIDASLLVRALRYAMERHRLVKTLVHQAESAAREQLVVLQQYTAASPVILYALKVEEGELRPLWVSENVESMLGYSVDEALQPDWWVAHIYPPDRKRAVTETAKLFETDSLEHEFRFVCKDERVVWIRDRLRLLRDEQGEPYLVVGASMDITESKRAEEHGRLLAAAVEGSTDVVVITDREGVLQWMNPAFEAQTGYSPEEAIGKTMRLLKSGEHPLSYYQQLWQAILKGQVWRGEVVNQRKDGTFYPSENVIVPVKDESGEVTHFVSVQRGIAERKRNEREIMRQHQVLTALHFGAQKLAESLDLQAVAQDVARLCVELFDVQLAWLGRALEDGRVEVLSWYPTDHPYPQKLVVRWDDTPEGQGQAGQAIRQGQPQIVDDLLSDPRFAPWRERAERYHFVSVAAFPLISRGRTFGILNLYSDRGAFFSSELRGVFQSLASLAAAALENARLYQEAQQRAQSIESINRMIAELNAEPEVHQAFPAITTRLKELTGCEQASIAVVDDHREAFTIVAMDRMQSGDSSERSRPLSETSVSAEVLAGRLYLSPDLAKEKDYPVERALYAAGYRSRISLPLIAGKNVIGALNLLWTRPRGWDAEQLPLLEQMAHALALALERSRLFEAERHRRRELEALFELSTSLRTARWADQLLPVLLAEAQQILHADAGMVVLRDEVDAGFTIAVADGVLAPNAGRHFNLEEGISGQVLRTRKAYRIDDYGAEAHALSLENGAAIGPAVFVPLESEEALMGVLMLARRNSADSKSFTEEEARLLAAMGEMVGNALRRMSLYLDAVRRLKHVQALRNIDLAITASLDSRVTLRVLLDEVASQLEVDAAAVLMFQPHTQELRFQAGRGFLTHTIERFTWRLGESLIGRAVLGRQTLFLGGSDEEMDNALRQLFQVEDFASGYVAPMISKRKALGVLMIFSRNRAAQNSEWVEFLEALAGQGAIAIDNARLFDGLEQSLAQLRLAYDATIEGWSRAMDLRDEETEYHTQRVTSMVLELARAAGMGDEELVHVRRGALLHDIGKIGVPDHILLKPGKLTEEEWEVMRQHPVYAYEFLSPIEYLRPALDIPYCHHEKWDGTGYPRGLKGEEIPLAARLFAVVDVWDALRSDRPYRKAWSEAQTLTHIRSQSGKHFDPRAVDLFFQMLKGDQG